MIDEGIVKKAIKGDEKAFLTLINNCKENIYRIAYAYVKNEELALDIVQETVCNAYASIEKLREPKYFNTWITRIAINESKKVYNKNKKIIYLEDKELQNNIGSKVEDNDERMYILDAINKLKDKHKEVIILKYFDDMTINEIANVLDMPIGTVKTYLNKGLETLREYMKKEIV